MLRRTGGEAAEDQPMIEMRGDEPAYEARPRSASLRERLDSFVFVRELDDASRERLASVARPLVQEAGTLILDLGSIVDPLVLLERGSLRVFRSSADGREITLYRVLPGEVCVLAVSGAVGGFSYPAQAVTESRVEGIALPASAVRRELEAHEGFRRYILRMLTTRLVESLELVSELAFDRVDVRLARRLLVLSARDNGLIAPIEMSHAELASELGTAREVVTRVLHSFEDLGLVVLGRRRITVADAEALSLRAGW